MRTGNDFRDARLAVAAAHKALQLAEAHQEFAQQEWDCETALLVEARTKAVQIEAEATALLVEARAKALRIEAEATAAKAEVKAAVAKAKAALIEATANMKRATKNVKAAEAAETAILTQILHKGK